jgi:hypothetical protein
VHERHGVDQAGQIEAGRREGDHEHADQRRIERVRDRDADRRAERERAVGRDAVPRDHLRVVRDADPADAPQDRAGAAQAFADAEHEPAADQQHEARGRPAREQQRHQQQHARHAAADQPAQHRLLRPQRIREAPGERTRRERREILDADRGARDDRGVAEIVVDEARQHRERQPDGQIADEREADDGHDLQRDGEPLRGGVAESVDMGSD